MTAAAITVYIYIVTSQCKRPTEEDWSVDIGPDVR